MKPKLARLGVGDDGGRRPVRVKAQARIVSCEGNIKAAAWTDERPAPSPAGAAPPYSTLPEQVYAYTGPAYCTRACDAGGAPPERNR